MNLLSGVLTGANLLTDAAGLGSAARQFFQMFVPDAHHNRQEKDWYWFDMLHYRRTGVFAQHLVSAAHSNQQKAFAYGYLSHIAADVVGHPYVNMIVGSPYRLNVQRHVAAENFQDAWKYHRYYSGESINQTLLARMGLPQTLPPGVGDLLDTAFRAAYGSLPPPRRPGRLAGDGYYTRADIDTTYDVFYKVLKLMESMAVERPTEPFTGAADILADALAAFSPPPDPPDTSSSSCSWEDILSLGLTENSRDCYENFFEEVANWLSYLGTSGVDAGNAAQPARSGVGSDSVAADMRTAGASVRHPAALLSGLPYCPHGAVHERLRHAGARRASDQHRPQPDHSG